jgi:aminobenzoyl-glutamate utilization protein B
MCAAATAPPTTRRCGLQATGRDARGRKQYRYHPRWRLARDEDKHARMLRFGAALPRLRRAVASDLRRPGLPREKVLALVVRLLDETQARVGNTEYARTNGSFGLSTLRDRHARFGPGGVAHLTFRGKGGLPHEIRIDDPRVARLVRRCQELPGQQLFQYVDEDGRRRGIDSGSVNAYLREKTRAELAQEMVDSIFSFGELGFQEFETHALPAVILRQNGFTVEEESPACPTAWVATLGVGQAGRRPRLGRRRHPAGVAEAWRGVPRAARRRRARARRRTQLRPGGEHRRGARGEADHGARQAAGHARDLAGRRRGAVAAKAYFVRDGLFKDVDVALFTHVVQQPLGVSGARGRGRAGVGRIHVPGRDGAQRRGALARPQRARRGGADERRLELPPRAPAPAAALALRHPSTAATSRTSCRARASVWYYFRETTTRASRNLWALADKMAQGAALMTGTEWSSRVLGAAWPQHFNKAVAETTYANISGRPARMERADQHARAGAAERAEGRRDRPPYRDRRARRAGPDEDNSAAAGRTTSATCRGTVPTVTLRYPSNIPNLPGHHWANAIAMATPIAHKGVVAGAKVQAMTLIDLLLKPELIEQAWDVLPRRCRRKTRSTARSSARRTRRQSS